MSNKIVLVYIKDYGNINEDGNWYQDRYLSYNSEYQTIGRENIRREKSV